MIEGLPVEVITYQGRDEFKVLTNSLVKFDSAFNHSLRRKSWMKKFQAVQNYLQAPIIDI